MVRLANYSCPSCGDHLREKVRRLMYVCRGCSEVVVETNQREVVR